MTSIPRQWPAPSGVLVEPRRLPLSSQVVPTLFGLLDSLAILSTSLVTYFFIVGYSPENANFYIVAVSFVWLSTLLLMNFGGLYHFEALMRPLAYIDKIVIAFVATFLFLLAAAFSLKISATFSRIWVTTFAVASCSTTLAFRLVASALLHRLSRLGLFTREIVIAGGGKQLIQLLAFIEREKPPFLSVKGICIDDPDALGALQARYDIVGRVEDVTSYARAHHVDDVVIALPWSNEDRLVGLVNALRELAVNVHLGADLIGFRLNYQASPSHFAGMPIFEVTGNPFSGWNAVIKRTEDYVLGGLATLLFLPLMLLVAVAIKLDSKGPVLFRQKRLGLLNEEFCIYKFRTMKHGPQPSGQTIQAQRNDPRVTRVGRILRRTSLDELPNLINVLNGTMSLVGPRPHALDHNESFSQTVTEYFVRHRVKPGLTGWAQVNGYRGEIDTPDKLEGRVRYDIYYAENWSFWFDVQILLRSVLVCLTGRNAY